MDDSTKLERAFLFYAATLFFFGVGAITTLGLSWYAGLVKPLWAPSETAVAVLWLILFAANAKSVSILWEKTRHNAHSCTSVLSTYLANALLVLLWSYLFFGLHQLLFAFWIAVAVGISTIILMIRIKKRSEKAAYLLFPYLAWVAFALLFTHSILLLNP